MIDEEERRSNEESLKRGRGHLVARFWASNGRQFIIFTPVGSAFTGVLLTQEYNGGLGWGWLGADSPDPILRK